MTPAMDDDNDLLRYNIKDNLCAKAIEEFKKNTSVKEWLDKNRSLYDSVSYQPPGLPRIITCNFGGQEFGNIQNFGRLYMAVDIIFNETKSNCS